MKNIFFIAIFLIFASSLIAEAQDQEFVAPADSIRYGLYSDGTVFIAKKLVDDIEGDAPKFMSELTNWEQKKMTLSADSKYYFFKAGINLPVEQKYIICFAIGGNRFIPHALRLPLLKEEITGVKIEDIVPNDQGNGYNFKIKPIPVSK